MHDASTYLTIIGVIFYLAMVHTAYDIIRLYTLKELLDMGESPTQSSVMIEFAKATKDIRESHAVLALFAYMWPIVLAVFLVIEFFRYIWRILTNFTYKKGN